MLRRLNVRFCSELPENSNANLHGGLGDQGLIVRSRICGVYPEEDYTYISR